MQTFGRYKVGRQLGVGSQGTVYLCGDPQLNRRVAIKLLNRGLFRGGKLNEAFAREARTLGRFQHPNIVSVYDVGSYNDRPYLVFEFVEGELLSQVIARGDLKLNAALKLFAGLTAGVAQAHAASVVHRDIKPANVMLSKDGTPKLMDFGIAQVAAPGEREKGLIGTPRYMAPEYIRGQLVSPAMDVFALGAVLYELLTRRPAFPGKAVDEVLAKILAGPPPKPSRFNDAVDDALDSLVLKALAARPEERFEHAGLLLEAVQACLESLEGGAEGERSARSTLDFVFRRMRRKQDFPTLSEAIRTINQLRPESDKDAERLAGVIVKDFALTQKILKVVNSAFYGNFAGKIGTISRAIVILGVEAIRSIAASLIFFEHLSDQATAERLKGQMASALFRALLAREVASELRMEGAEECFVSAMFHRLGEVLVSYYLPDEAEEIERLENQDGLSRTQAEKRILGVGSLDVGMAVAKHWNFPAGISENMKSLPDGAPKRSEDPARRLHQVVCFADQATELLGGDHSETAVKGLLSRFRAALGVDTKRFNRALDSARHDFRDLGQKLLAGGKDGVGHRLLNISQAEETQADITATVESTISLEKSSSEEPVSDERDVDAILSSGLQEATNLLLESNDLNQLFNVVLETLYRALAFRRVVLCLPQASAGGFAARLGFGNDISEFIKRFRIPSVGKSNVFEVSLAKGVDVYIANVNDPKIRGDLPEWFLKLSDAGSFVVFPVMLQQRAIGFVYGEFAVPEGMEMTAQTFNLIKSLRNQMVLALRQRS